MAALLLSTLILGNVEQASAQTACAEGTQSGVRCEIEGPAPTTGADGLTCDDSFELDGTRCVRYELARGVDLTCEVGTLELDQCVETGAPPAPSGPDQCPTSDTVFEDNAGCYEAVLRVGGDTCPLGSTVAPDGQSCRLPVDPIVEQVPGAACPAGFAKGNGPAVAYCSRIDDATLSAIECGKNRGTASGDCYQAQPLARVCVQGEYAGDICQIEGNPPQSVPFCPINRDGVFLDGEFCYILVDALADGVCAAAEVLDPSGSCRQGIPLQSGPPFCEPGFGVLNGRCVAYLADSIIDDACSGTIDEFGLCRVAVDDRQAELLCEQNYEALEGSDCVVRVDVGATCPDGFVSDPTAGCIQNTDATQRMADCPAGARGILDGCYILVAKGPRGPLECSQGELRGELCAVTQAPETNAAGDLECPAAFALVDGECVVLLNASQSPAQCPQGSFEILNVGCRKPVANASGAYYCPLVADSLSGKICSRTTSAFSPDADNGNCPAGFTVDGGVCIRTTPATLSDVGCPDGALGAVDSCFVYLPGSNGATATCAEGQPTSDGTQCFVFPRTTPQPDTVSCPEGYEADDSLGGICARFEPATEGGVICPDGARGVPGACYILVAKGPRSAPICDEGTLQGGTCVIEGEPPSQGAATCPVDATVMEDADGCFRLVVDPLARFVCTADGSGAHNTGPYLLVDGVCRFAVSAAQVAGFPGGNYICPAAVVDGFDVQGDFALAAEPTDEIAGYCTLTGADLNICVTPDIDNADGCRRTVPLRGGPDMCEPRFGLIDGKCVRYEDPIQIAAQCPGDAVEDANGDCRKPVADATAPYTCEDPDAALNGTSCVFTAGFITTPNPPLIECDRGLYTELSPGFVLCILGDATQVTTPCPAGAEAQADGRCVRLVGNARGTYYCENPSASRGFDTCALLADVMCPIDYSQDDSLGGLCARFEPASVSPGGNVSFCQDVDAVLNGRACVFTTDFIYQCETGPCGGTTEVSRCPASPGVTADGDDCFQQVSFESAVCPDATEALAGSSLCRKTVPLEQQPLACAAGYQHVGDACVRYSNAAGAPDFDCAATGLGSVACNQVIGATQGLATGALLSQRQTTLTYADCAGGTGTVLITAGDQVALSSALTEDPAGQYNASFSISTADTYSADVTIVCPDGETNTQSAELVFIDPAGIVTDCVGNPVEGAVVTLLRSASATGSLVAVPDGDETVMDPAINTQNPSTTNAQGFYRWDVVGGFYQVSVSFDGQEAVQSEVVQVPPARTDLDLVFTELNCAIEPTPTATAVPTAAPVQRVVAGTSVQPIGPTSITNAPPAVVQPAPSTASQPLAITGSETFRIAALGITMTAIGAAGLVASRRRHDALDG